MEQHMKDYVWMQRGEKIEKVPCEPTDEIIVRMNAGWVQVREENLPKGKK